MNTIAFLSLVSIPAIAASDAIPSSFDKERYEETRAASPFVLATKVEKVDDTPPPNPFANMYIVGLGKADGKDYVTIVRAGEESTPLRIWGNAENEDGYQVLQVMWADGFGKSKVKIKKGSDVGEIGFNENAVKAAVAGTPIAPQSAGGRPPGFPGGGIPNVPGAPAGMQKPMTQGGIPSAVPSFPKPPTAGTQSGFSVPRPSTPPASGAPGQGPTQSRSRIRVIGK